MMYAEIILSSTYQRLISRSMISNVKNAIVTWIPVQLIVQKV